MQQWALAIWWITRELCCEIAEKKNLSDFSNIRINQSSGHHWSCEKIEIKLLLGHKRKINYNAKENSGFVLRRVRAPKLNVTFWVCWCNNNLTSFLCFLFRNTFQIDRIGWKCVEIIRKSHVTWIIAKITSLF